MVTLSKTQEELKEFEELVEYCKIGEYTHWNVHVDIKQYYLGRVFIWAKRYDAQELTDITFQEREELFSIILQDVLVMYKLAEFSPDIMNYSSLGNEMHHCHMHVVPRYKSPRIFEGEEFIDEFFGKNFGQGDDKANRILSSHLQDSLILHLKESLEKARKSRCA